jgi:ribosomal protein S1
MPNTKKTKANKSKLKEAKKAKKVERKQETENSKLKTENKEAVVAEAEVKTEKEQEKTSMQPERVKLTETPTTMEELLNMTGYKLKAPRKGDVVDGVVTEVNKRMVLVDIGAKTEGMVVDQEYEATADLIQNLAVGDNVSVFVVSPENDRGQILLSLKRAAVDRKWEQFSEFLETGKVVSVRGLEINRGGMIVAVETLRGFVPSSQFGKEYLGKMEKLLNRDFDVKVIEVDKAKNRLIFSEREVSEAQAIQNRNRALDVIKIGEIYEGVVSGIMPFGAFVTVTVPLIQESEVSSQKSAKKKTTEKVEIKPEKETFGQVEGLVHISEISWEKVNDPNDYFTQGDRVKVKVLGIDNGKLNLSVKQLTEDPWKNILKKYEIGTSVKGRVTRVEPFGVFVTLEPGVDGLIHISKIDAGKEPEVGKDIDVIVDSVDVENRRMSLGVVLTEVPVGYK